MRTASAPAGLPPPGVLERLLQAIGRSQPLDRLGQALGNAFARVVGAGKVKDALSGSWLGHPLHPLLTDIPIGAWTSATVFDVFGEERAADALVGLGIVAALPTALSGLSDLTDVVDDGDRRIGAAHAAGNVAAVTLYAASYVARRRGKRVSGRILSELGLLSLTAAGFLGGHLAYRRGLGVDQNVFQRSLKDWAPVIDDSELIEGKPRRVEIDGKDVVIYRSAGRVYALSDRCSHRGGPLHEGEIVGETITCPWHASTFDLNSGEVVRGPATAPQRAYDVRVHERRIEIRDRTAST